MDALKQAVIEAFKTAAPGLCKAIDDTIAKGGSRKLIGMMIDHQAPKNTVTNQGAHLYLDSKFNR